MPSKTTKAGLPYGLTRATFIIRESILEDLKAISYYERKTMQDCIEDALSEWLKSQPPVIKRMPE